MRVTKKVYEQRLKQQAIAKKFLGYANHNSIKVDKLNTEVLRDNISTALERRRIVNLSILGQNLFCKECHSVLSLCDVKSEVSKGLVSIFYIPCRKCKSINQVDSDKHRQTLQKRNSIRFDTNTKAVMGNYNYRLCLIGFRNYEV